MSALLDAWGRRVLVTVVEGLVDSAALVAAIDADHRTPVEPGPPPRVLVVGASVAPYVEAACRWVVLTAGNLRRRTRRRWRTAGPRATRLCCASETCIPGCVVSRPST